MDYCTVDVINFAEIKALINSLNEITERAQIEVDESKISSRVIDYGNILIMESNLEKEWFGTYQYENSGKIVIDTEELKKVANKIKDKDKVRIQITDDNITLIVKNESHVKLKVEGKGYELNPPEPPKVYFTGEMNFNIKHLEKTVKTLDGLCEDVEFNFKGNNLFIGDSDNKSKLYGRPWQGGEHYTKLSHRKIIPVIKAVDFCKRVTISYGTCIPMKFSLKSTRAGGSVYFLIANKISEEEELKDEEIHQEAAEEVT